MTATETAADKTFQFKVQDATLLRSLRPGLSFGVEPALRSLAAGQPFSLVLGGQTGRLQPKRTDQCCNLVDPPASGSPQRSATQPRGIAAGYQSQANRAQTAGPRSPQAAPPKGAEGILRKGVANPKRALHRTIDPCVVASELRLHDVLEAASSYAFPLKANKGSCSVRVSDPDLREISCPNLAITVRAAVRARFKEGILSVTKDGTMRFRAPGEVRVEYRAPLGSDQPETPADVWSAQACLTDIDVVGLDLKGVPNWLDSTLIQDCLNGDLPGWTGCRDVVQEMCRDITDLMQAYVAQGGEL